MQMRHNSETESLTVWSIYVYSNRGHLSIFTVLYFTNRTSILSQLWLTVLKITLKVMFVEVMLGFSVF